MAVGYNATHHLVCEPEDLVACELDIVYIREELEHAMALGLPRRAAVARSRLQYLRERARCMRAYLELPRGAARRAD